MIFFDPADVITERDMMRLQVKKWFFLEELLMRLMIVIYYPASIRRDGDSTIWSQ